MKRQTAATRCILPHYPCGLKQAFAYIDLSLPPVVPDSYVNGIMDD